MSQIGYENLLWFMGVVEDRNDPQKLGRVKVRCFNVHPQDKNEVPTDDLPWAYLISGTFTADVKPPKLNTWVFGFFIDGRDCQHPMIIGALNGMPTQLPSVGAGGEVTSPGGIQSDDDIPDIFQPDFSRLARAESLEQTSVVAKNISADELIPTADGKGWTIPRSPYAAQYPHNRVYESSAGHVMEFDDTPGCERINIYHSAGTWVEIDSLGNMMINAGGTKTEITNENSLIYIRSNRSVTVEGQDTLYVKGNCNLKVDGDLTTTTHGDYTLNVGGKYAVNVSEGIKQRAANIQIESIAENVEIKSAVDIINNSVSNFSIKSGLDTYVNSGTNMHILSGDNLYQTATSTLHLKASGGDLFVESSANLQTKTGTNINLTSGASTNINSGSNINAQASGIFAVDASLVQLNSPGFGSAEPAGEAEESLQGLDAVATEMSEPPEKKTVVPKEGASKSDFGFSGIDDTSDSAEERSSAPGGDTTTSNNPGSGGGFNGAEPGTLENLQGDYSGDVPTGGGMNALLAFIASGEGGYESVNRGTSGGRIIGSDLNATRNGKSITQLTFREIFELQSIRDPFNPNRIFAVGRYQIIPSTMRGVFRASGLSLDDTFSPANQDRLGTILIVGTENYVKRPTLAKYIRGQDDNLQRAMIEFAQEWASVPDPRTGNSYYGSGNRSAHSVQEVQEALNQAREDFINQQQGPSSPRPDLGGSTVV